MDEDEAARAAAADELGLLGAPADAELDAVVRVAAAVTGAAHATVTLFGASRQCLLADGAFRATDPASGDLPCARVVRGGRTVHVADARTDPALATSAWVDGREGALRMYASVPLVTAAGHAVGTLCVGDPTPRALPASDLARLEDLAGVVVALLERHLTARALAERTAELERSNSELERFAAAASHDLRSPLTVVEGYLELLQDTCGDALPPRAREWVATALRSARRMEELTTGLLAYASAGAAAPPVLLVETSELLEAAVADLRVEIEAAGASVTAGALPRAACDPVAVRQVLQNLLANAVRHRAPERPCRVVVSATPTAEGGWAFAVADNGRGVAPADRERVFAMFATVRAGSARTPSDRDRGHGIGLATCQRLVARGGGRIWLEGTPGGGTTARFTVPPARGARRGRPG